MCTQYLLPAQEISVNETCLEASPDMATDTPVLAAMWLATAQQLTGF